MTTKAIAGGFAVCQTRLGAKVHDPKDPGADLGPMFRQVVATILRLADAHAERWLDVRGSHDVPVYGFERLIDPPPLAVNTLRLMSEFQAGSIAMAETWAEMLAPATLETVLELAGEAGKRFDDASRRLGVHGGDTGASGGSRAASAGPSTQRWPTPWPASTSPTTLGPPDLRPGRERRRLERASGAAGAKARPPSIATSPPWCRSTSAGWPAS